MAATLAPGVGLATSTVAVYGARSATDVHALRGLAGPQGARAKTRAHDGPRVPRGRRIRRPAATTTTVTVTQGMSRQGGEDPDGAMFHGRARGRCTNATV